MRRFVRTTISCLILGLGAGGGDDPPAPTPDPGAATSVIPTFDEELRSRAIDFEIVAIQPVE